MTLSARNHLKGTIEEIQHGGVLSHVTIKVQAVASAGRHHVFESVLTRLSAAPRRG